MGSSRLALLGESGAHLRVRRIYLCGRGGFFCILHAGMSLSYFTSGLGSGLLRQIGVMVAFCLRKKKKKNERKNVANVSYT